MTRLFSALIALAMLFAPTIMFGGGMASAMPRTSVSATVANCDGMPTKTQENAPDQGCCVTMCAALAAPQLRMNDRLMAPAVRPVAQMILFCPGLPAKLETPPPRRA